jgi:hypothetical protein
MLSLQSQTVVDAAQKKPHLKVMCGFSRRFDDSYRDAFQKMDSGLIGRPSILRSQTCDKLEYVETILNSMLDALLNPSLQLSKNCLETLPPMDMPTFPYFRTVRMTD